MAVWSHTIADDADDGFTSWGGLDTTGAVVFGTDWGDPQVRTYLRFPGAPMQPGDQVEEAILTLNPSWAGAGTLNVLLHAANVDNWPQPGSTAAVNNAPITSAQTAISMTSAQWNSTAAFDVDVTAQVQAIVDRGGWTAGNAIAFIAVNNGTTGDGAFEVYGGNGLRPSSLSVTYVPSTPPAPPPTPTGVTVTPADTTAQVTWNPAPGAASYEVEWEQVAVPAAGSASTGWSVTTAAAGATTTSGAAGTSWTVATTAAGSTTRAGTAGTAWSVATAAGGTTQRAGTGATSWRFTTAAVGATERTGQATTGWTAATTTAGSTTRSGAAGTSWRFTTAASGRAPDVDETSGQAATSWTVATTAEGSTLHTGTAAVGWNVQTASAGSTARTGTAATSWTFATAAAGRAPGVDETSGSASTSWSVATAAAGATIRSGTAHTSWRFATRATGPGGQLPPLTRPVAAAFTHHGRGQAAFTRDQVTAAAFTHPGTGAGAYVTDGTGAAHYG